MENYRAHGVYPGLKLTYTNLHGQETIQIKVTAPEDAPVEEPPDYTPWDWLLVDMRIPAASHDYGVDGIKYTYAVTGARLLVPNEDVADEPAGLKPAHGRAFDYSLTDSAQQRSAETRLQFAGSDLREQIGTLTTHADIIQTSSLLVDIRPYFKVPQIVVELYGKLEPLPDENVEVTTITGKRWIAVWERKYDNTNTVQPGWPKLHYRNTLSVEEVDEVVGYYPQLAGAVYTARSSTELRNEFLGHSVSGGNTDEQDMLLTSAYLDPTLANTTHQSFIRYESGAWVPAGTNIFSGTPAQVLARYVNAQAMAQIVSSTPFGDYGNGLIRYELTQWKPAGTWEVGVPPSTPPTDPIEYTINVHDIMYVWGPQYTTDVVATPVPASTTVDVYVSAFRGDPGWAWSEHSADGYVDYLQWDSENRYPERYQLGLVADGVAITDDLVPANAIMDSMQLLGVLIFDQRTGGSSFKAAQ